MNLNLECLKTNGLSIYDYSQPSIMYCFLFLFDTYMTHCIVYTPRKPFRLKMMIIFVVINNINKSSTQLLKEFFKNIIIPEKLFTRLALYISYIRHEFVP